MRGNTIHSSLQFQGWKSWDLRKSPEPGEEEGSLMRDIMEGASHIILNVHFQRWRVGKKITKHVVTVPSRCEFLKRLQISTPFVSYCHRMQRPRSVVIWSNLQECYGYIYSESKMLLNIPFKMDSNSLMSWIHVLGEDTKEAGREPVSLHSGFSQKN